MTKEYQNHVGSKNEVTWML